MPSIKPFRGIIYNKEKTGSVAKVVAPPYDVIPPDMQDELYKKHDDNIVRLILGKIKDADNESDNRYTRANDFFESWLGKGILVKDKEPAIYIYSQKYKYGKRQIDRFGFIGLMKLESERRSRLNATYVSGSKVLPHENTLKAPKADRLNLMRSVKANLSPVFMLYDDEAHRVSGVLKSAVKGIKPFIDVDIDSVRHRAWKLTDRRAIKKIEKFMGKKDVFIADGHHRYETAMNYANEIEGTRGAPQTLKDNSKYLMAYFCELDDKTLTILPTHRLIKDTGSLGREEIIKRLEKAFVVEKLASAKKLFAGLGTFKDKHVFGMYLGKGGFYRIRLEKEDFAEDRMGAGSKAWKNLDVAILHLFIIQNVLALRDEDDNIEFVKDPESAIKSVDAGNYKIAFFLNPTKVTQMKKVARAGEKMPRKATYFYPKPLSGIVINKF